MNIHIHIVCNKKELARERINFYKSAISILGKNNVSYGYLKKTYKTKQLIYVWFDPPSHLIPTFIFSSDYSIYIGIDSYKSTLYRILLSNIFTKTYFMHPIKDRNLYKLIAKNISTISHSITKKDITKKCTKKSWSSRKFDVGFAGSTKGENYIYREKLLRLLSKYFKINKWNQYYKPEKVIDLYSESRIIISMPRNDYKIDANTRCFEGMAAGSLLITPEKSELRFYGYIPKKDYIEYSNADELINIIRKVLKNPGKYRKIALNGQAKTFKNHTYENITKKILLDFKLKNRSSINLFRKIFGIIIYFIRKAYQKLFFSLENYGSP